MNEMWLGSVQHAQIDQARADMHRFIAETNAIVEKRVAANRKSTAKMVQSLRELGDAINGLDRNQLMSDEGISDGIEMWFHVSQFLKLVADKFRPIVEDFAQEHHAQLNGVNTKEIVDFCVWAANWAEFVADARGRYLVRLEEGLRANAKAIAVEAKEWSVVDGDGLD